MAGNRQRKTKVACERNMKSVTIRMYDAPRYYNMYYRSKLPQDRGESGQAIAWNLEGYRAEKGQIINHGTPTSSAGAFIAVAPSVIIETLIIEGLNCTARLQDAFIAQSYIASAPWEEMPRAGNRLNGMGKSNITTESMGQSYFASCLFS